MKERVSGGRKILGLGWEVFFFLHTIDEPMCRDLELKMWFGISDHVTPGTAPNIVVAAAAAARSSGPKNIENKKERGS